MSTDPTNRCPWCGQDSLYVAYHDREWGVPSRDDRHLFEMLILEGAQAGLSWITILRKRERYREVFGHFDPAVVASYDAARVGNLLQDPGIVRNRLKITSTIDNARHFLAIQEKHGSFATWLWRYVENEPVINRFQGMSEIPASTELSDRISRDLKKAGFRFVGSTIIYAFLQAVGLVNDHLVTCPRWAAVQA